MANHDAILALLVSSYARPAAVIIREDKPKVQAKPKAQAKGTASKAAPKVTPVTDLPAKGSLEAKGFIKLMLNAQSRDEKIRAIAAYIGYDLAGDFGTQELTAKMQAQRELRPVAPGVSRTELRSAQRSAMGYVAGMPNEQRKAIDNLLAREKLAAEERDRQVRMSKDDSLSLADREMAAGMAAVEHRRLKTIQKDLEQYGIR